MAWFAQRCGVEPVADIAENPGTDGCPRAPLVASRSAAARARAATASQTGGVALLAPGSLLVGLEPIAVLTTSLRKRSR